MDAILLGELTDILGSMSSDSDTKHEEIKSLLNTIDANVDSVLAANLNHGSQEYSAAGTYTWTCPEGVSEIYIIASGASGGGGGGYYGTGGSSYSDYNIGASGGAAGGSGAVWYGFISVVQDTTYSLVVGAGGSAGSGATTKQNTTYDRVDQSVAAKAGGAGGATKFGDLLLVSGGNGGAAGLEGYSGDKYDYSPSIPSGGAGGKITIENKKNKYVELYNGTDGGSGKKGANGGGDYKAATGGSGGAGTANYLGIKGGSGGAAGAPYYSFSSSTYASSINGKAGSKGSAGYIKIFW